MSNRSCILKNYALSYINMMNTEYFRFNLDVKPWTCISLFNALSWKTPSVANLLTDSICCTLNDLKQYSHKTSQSHKHITPFLVINHNPGYDWCFYGPVIIQYSACLLNDNTTLTLLPNIFSWTLIASRVVLYIALPCKAMHYLRGRTYFHP